MTSEVFISHSRTSTPAAKKLADALRAYGVSSWGDGEREPNGGQWRSATREALDQSRAVVFLIDPRGEPGSRVRDEWSEALESAWAQPSKRLIPLLIQDAQAPPFLRARQALRVNDTTEDLDRAARSVVDALNDETHPLGAVDPAALAEAREEWRRRLDEIAVAAKSMRRE